MTAHPEQVDVAIVGGGLTGLTFAALVARNALAASIAVIEARPPAAWDPDSDMDLRVSALAPASRALLDSVDVWTQLPQQRVKPYTHMTVWQAAGRPDGERAISFDAAELGQAELGYIVENRVLRQFLWTQLERAANVNLVTDTQPRSITETPTHSELHLEGDAVLSAKLVVGADGASSWVREQAGIDFAVRPYGQAGVVAHIATEQPHRDTAWQRFLPDGPVALLPLPDGRCSLVWSCPESQADMLVEMDAAEFNSALTEAFDGALGELTLTSQRARFPLAMGYARRYSAGRVVLIGDAAHRVHPLAGQGANLGLLDAAVLADLLVEWLDRPYTDPGDRQLLRRYERARKGDNLLTMSAMDMFNRLFAPPLADVAGIGMGVVDRVPGLKNRLAGYAMGRGRDLPVAAQPD